MTARSHPQRSLDVASFAADGASLAGRWPLAQLARLADGGVGEDVRWSVQGQLRAVPGGEPETWLHLAATARVQRECQRCLQPVELVLEVARALRFVAGEVEAAALDAECEDDVLALPRSLDLRELVEDELLLALPLVPAHEHCPRPLPMRVGEPPDDDDDEPDPTPHPFAALARLKSGKGH